MPVERAFWYFGQTNMAALGYLPQQLIPIRGFGDFYARALGVGSITGGNAGFSFRCKRGDSLSYFQSDLVPQENLTAFDCSLMPIAPEVAYPLNGNFQYDIRNDQAVEDTGMIVLQGVNKLPDSDCRPYPADYFESSYRLGVEFVIAAANRLLPFREIRLPMRSLPFTIKTLHWQFDPVFSAAAPTSLRVRLYDEEKQMFSNDLVPVDFMFRRGVDGHRFGTPYPEILIPAGRAAYFDAVIENAAEAGGPWRVTLCFGGDVLSAK